MEIIKGNNRFIRFIRNWDSSGNYWDCPCLGHGSTYGGKRNRVCSFNNYDNNHPADDSFRSRSERVRNRNDYNYGEHGTYDPHATAPFDVAAFLKYLDYCDNDGY